MSASTTCMENIVGLSRTDCQCVDDRPVDAGVSLSGLYIDELDGLDLLMVKAGTKCGEGTLWDKLAKARQSAIEETKSALVAWINSNTDPRRIDGINQIGEDKKATAQILNLNNAYHGMTLMVPQIRGGSFEITAIGTAFKPTDGMPATITVNVYEYESLSSDPIATYILPITGGKTIWTELPTPLGLDLSSLGPDKRYWFLFQPAAGMKAMNTLINCNCGGFDAYWNPRSPQYGNVQTMKGDKKWVEWAMAAGTRGTTLADRELWTTDNPSDGIMVRAKFSCDSMSTFCDLEANYATDDIQNVLAHTVRFRAAANITRSLQSTTTPNIYTMTSGEQMTANRRKWDSEWEKRISEFLGPELSQPLNVNRYGDCRRCKDNWGMRRSMIK